MNANSPVPSTVGATYVEPSAAQVLEPGLKLGDLYQRNMTQPYVLQRLAERVYWVQSFNYGTVFYIGDQGVLIFDTLEGVYDNIAAAVASVTDKPVTAAIYPHYHADHIGDIDKYVTAAGQAGHSLRIFGSEKSRQAMELSNSSFPEITDVVDWPQGSFEFEDCTVELHGFEWAAHTDDHAAWLIPQDGIVHSSDLINPDQPPFWKFAGNERFHWHEHNLRQVYDLDWRHLSGSHGNLGTREDIDFEFAFVADMKNAVGEAIGAHPFTDPPGAIDAAGGDVDSSSTPWLASQSWSAFSRSMVASCSAALLLAGESVMTCSFVRKDRPSPAAVHDEPLLAELVDLAA